MRMIPVESSTVEAVGYEPESQTLFVVFKRHQQLYEFKGITTDLFNGLLDAPSVGSYIHKVIEPICKGVPIP